MCGYYGGSTQAQLGPGPGVDPIHEQSLRAALLTGESLELTDPGESEDIGHDWSDPRALTEFGDREQTEPWTWAGPARSVTGRTWGGCIEVIQWILTAGRFPTDPGALSGGVLLLETSEELIPCAGVRLDPACPRRTRDPDCGGSRRRGRHSVRSHPATVDRPVRRLHDGRRRDQPPPGRLQLTARGGDWCGPLARRCDVSWRRGNPNLTTTRPTNYL